MAVSDGHPFARRGEIDVDELADQVWIVGASTGEPQFGAWPTLTEPTIGHRVRSWQTRLGFVAAGLGISVLPGLAADMVPRGVTWLRVGDADLVQRRRTVLVTAEGRSVAADAFVRALREEVLAFADAAAHP